MNKAFHLERLISLRREIHKHAEIYFKEFETQRRIREYLLSLGIKESAIRNCAGTGLVVDIEGSGPRLSEKRKIVAFRADIDALPVSEDHSHLEYKSVTGNSHLCGHDGHIACLLGGASLFLENSGHIPANHIVRLLFQPAEEFEGGAKVMVAEGALEGVSEVWGMHNHPLDPPNAVFAKPGVMSSGAEGLKIEISGRGGHSSRKADLKNPVLPLCEINVLLEKELTTTYKDVNNKEIIFSLPKLVTSGAFNVIPEKAEAEGSLRYYDSNLHKNFSQTIKNTIEGVCKEQGVTGCLHSTCHYPIINNDPQLVKELDRIVGGISEQNCPMKASEDFSEFSNKVPGCFFFYAIGTKAGEMIHAKGYDFNDEVIEPVSKLWLKIMLDRLKKD